MGFTVLVGGGGCAAVVFGDRWMRVAGAWVSAGVFGVGARLVGGAGCSAGVFGDSWMRVAGPGCRLVCSVSVPGWWVGPAALLWGWGRRWGRVRCWARRVCSGAVCGSPEIVEGSLCCFSVEGSVFVVDR